MAPYENPDLPIDERVKDLLSRMTLHEKMGQMLADSPAIERLGMPKYYWWNECLHGVARAGSATVFPQAIGLAATWDPNLIHTVATAISDEARAKHHETIRNNRHAQYFGLTFWTPNINIFRDPRWGRGQETYGEDPYLTGRIGVALVKGLQGDDPRYLKLCADAKHFAVHSGPESERHTFDAVVSGHDLRETYLPAFKALVQEAKVESVMGAYNRTNGEACNGSKTLLTQILREEWGFEGHVVSDCGAIDDFHMHHKITADAAESAALALHSGCDLNCGDTYKALPEAHERGLITEADIDRAITRLMTTRMKLGMFDPPGRVPYASIPTSVVDCPAHRALARQAARESVVLLKNDGILPLSKNLGKIIVIGPCATSFDALMGNYSGISNPMVTILEGIVGAVGKGTAVEYHQGCGLVGDAGYSIPAWATSDADLVIAVIGLTPRIEGEEGDAADSDSGGDRKRIGLPGKQEQMLMDMAALGKPVVAVVTGGSAIALNWANENLPAVAMAWYPGAEGGNGVADVLFGEYNPSGRLPVTFYKSVDDLPPFTNYNMEGHTYRYFRGEPLYPFGYGLSYTTYTYAGLDISGAGLGQPVTVKASVTNTGKVAGDEVVQVYVTDVDAPGSHPIRSLKAFARITLSPGETKQVTFELAPASFVRVHEDGREEVAPGRYQISVGGGQPVGDNAARCLIGEITLLTVETR